MKEQPELPRGVALAWGLVPSPRRGPKREMSVERIVQVAAEIADESGLTGVSMTAIAARLGFTTMSLYRYVSAKEDLLVLLGEYGIGRPPPSIAEAENWRDGLARWHAAAREAYRARPWLLDLPIAGAPLTPNNLAWLESALTVLARTPLPRADRLSAAILISGQTRWEASIARSYSELSRDGVSREARGRLEGFVYGALATPEAYPVLADTVRNAGMGGEESTFRFGLDRILDGLEMHMQRSPDGE
jgi:AcrR family transcriptional regulator